MTKTISNMTGGLDHIMYGVRDLAAGMDEIEARTGVRPAFGGYHQGNGTCNALLSLGHKQYLEIIAPDPEQGLGGTLGEALIGQRAPGIRTWAVAVPDLDDVVRALADLGMTSKIVDMGRTREDGVQLAWRILLPSDHDFGDQLPFFIDWQNCPHPADTAPAGCTLTDFAVSVADPESYRRVMAALGVEVTVDQSDAGSIVAHVDSPRGQTKLLDFRVMSDMRL